jgi:KipI family sensor histidine kinase inhibitor
MKSVDFQDNYQSRGIPMAMIAFDSLGDRAYLARFATEREAAGWAAAVRACGWTGIVDVVLAYQTVAVFADPDRIDLSELESRLRAVAPAEEWARAGARWTIPVLYDGADLDAVSQLRNLSRDDVIAFHCGQEYDVFAIGFQPGFPYAGYLPAALCGLPRREAPRPRVPAGSVAIAGRQTGIYPSESPGGWHLLGRTPLSIAVLNDGYFPIQSGDRIRFQPITPEEFEARRHERLREKGPSPTASHNRPQRRPG